MKALLLAVALWSIQWQENQTEMYAGLTCATRHEVETIASISQRYSFASTVERRTNCLFMAFNGVKTGESDAFSIGGTLFSFYTIRVEGGQVYVLQELGEGWTA